MAGGLVNVRLFDVATVQALKLARTMTLAQVRCLSKAAESVVAVWVLAVWVVASRVAASDAPEKNARATARTNVFTQLLLLLFLLLR